MTETVKVTSGKALLMQQEETKPARQVFGKFIHEGELSILFGDSNAGKSILANDIAFFVSGGGHEWEGMVSPNIPTLYVDMEMTGVQFARRYHNAVDYITDNYSRAEVDMNSTSDKWEFVRSKIITMQGQPNAPKFIIIDNITNGFGSIFSAKKMLSLVAELKTMKARFGLTILLIAHCPKRNRNKPITQDSLGGSKMIINFVDSAFAIGTSVQGEDIRYIKQIKARECGKSELVTTVRIKDEPYLSMHKLDTTAEETHISTKVLAGMYYDMTPEQEIELCCYLESNRDASQDNYMSYYEISDKTGIPVDFIVSYDIEHYILKQG